MEAVRSPVLVVEAHADEPVAVDFQASVEIGQHRQQPGTLMRLQAQVEVNIGPRHQVQGNAADDLDLAKGGAENVQQPGVVEQPEGIVLQGRSPLPQASSIDRPVCLFHAANATPRLAGAWSTVIG